MTSLGKPQQLHEQQQQQQTTSSSSNTATTTTPDFARDGWTLLSQGAEARVWRKDAVVCKERFVKTYRHPVLDERLNRSRGRAEARLLQRCRDRGILVPTVQSVHGSCIYMNYIAGGVSVRDYIQERLLVTASCVSSSSTAVPATIKDDGGHRGPGTTSDSGTTCIGAAAAVAVLPTPMQQQQQQPQQQQQQQQPKQHLERLATTMGQLIAHLHHAGIIHGDLTTSNMIMLMKDDDDSSSSSIATTTAAVVGAGSSKFSTALSSSLCCALIDFGLAKSHTSSEERAVDLYVLERALSSTHPDLPETFLPSLLRSYEEQMMKMAKQEQQQHASGVGNAKKNQQGTLQRLEQVRQRGRKRECFG